MKATIWIVLRVFINSQAPTNEKYVLPVAIIYNTNDTLVIVKLLYVCTCVHVITEFKIFILLLKFLQLKHT